MDLRGIGRALWRQWPVALVIGIVTLFVAMSAADRVETKYQGQASLLFMSSPLTRDNQGDPISVNPLNLSGNAERVASAAMLALSRSPGFEDALRVAGARGDLRLRRTSDAILEAKTKAATPAGAIETLDTAILILRQQLDAQQAAAGAPPGSYLKMETLAHSGSARQLDGNPFRAVGAIALVGIVVAIAAVVALDAVAPHGFRRGAGWVVDASGRLVRRLANPPPPPVSPSSPPPARTAPPPERVPVTANREARRRAARAGRGNGAGATPRPAREREQPESASRPS